MCAEDWSAVHESYWTKEDDMWSKRWHVDAPGHMWCNPPFHADFVTRLLERVLEPEPHDITPIIACLPTSTDRKWWGLLTQCARRPIFITSRVAFEHVGEDGTPRAFSSNPAGTILCELIPGVRSRELMSVSLAEVKALGQKA